MTAESQTKIARPTRTYRSGVTLPRRAGQGAGGLCGDQPGGRGAVSEVCPLKDFAFLYTRTREIKPQSADNGLD